MRFWAVLCLLQAAAALAQIPVPTGPQSRSEEATPQAALTEAEREGVLRRAADADLQTWLWGAAQNAPKLDVPPVANAPVSVPRLPRFQGAYVVLKPFTYPAGLYGAHSAVFFIAKGVPRPSGNPGHSTVYDFNTYSCMGIQCGRLPAQ